VLIIFRLLRLTRRCIITRFIFLLTGLMLGTSMIVRRLFSAASRRGDSLLRTRTG